MSTYTHFASIIATFTPKDGSAPVQYKADTTLDEEDLLSEPSPAKERGRRFMSNDGEYSQVIQRFASNGTRDIMIFDSVIADKLIGWAQANPTKKFDFEFRYVRDELDASSVRIQSHKDCFIQNTPARVINNEQAAIKFTINYGKLSVTDGAGNPVG